MANRYFFSTLTRIADLSAHSFTVQPLSRDQWATGDYVVGEVLEAKEPLAVVELANGRMAHIMPGDLIVGAFGLRRATLEAVGDWQSIQDDLLMHNLTPAGLFGRLTSAFYLLPTVPTLRYRGHCLRSASSAERKLVMQDFVIPLPECSFNIPTLMIIGTSMSVGKTTTARIIIHQLKQQGLRVVGAKLTGAGRYRDILSMQDAGADRVFDFVDVGLPSSVVPPVIFRPSLHHLLHLIAAEEPDVLVAEAGASPHEPYNGSIVLAELQPQIRCVVLCASDPYAVLGVSQSFGLQPDLVSGVTTSTSAGIELVEKMTGVTALNLAEPSGQKRLNDLLIQKLALPMKKTPANTHRSRSSAQMD